jgi:hypothetical protein
MARTKAAVVVPVLPGMVEVVVIVVAPVVVADPSAVVAVDVGSIGMSFMVAKAALVPIAMLGPIVTVAVAIWSVMRNVVVVPVVVTIMIAIAVMVVMILGHGVCA